MTQKFVMGSPIYRQEQELKRQGIPLSRQTMSNWILKASQVYLKPVYEQLHKELLKREVLHADETTLQVQHIPRNSWRDSRAISIRTAMPDTTISPKRLRWLAAGHICGESLTKQ